MLLGEIGAAQGLRGEVRIRAYTEEPGGLMSYGPLDDEGGTRRIEIESVQGHAQGVDRAHQGRHHARGGRGAHRHQALYFPRAAA